MSEPSRPEREGTSEPSFADAVAAAARRSGLGRVEPGQAPTASALLSAIGGVRGLIESILPGLVFLTVYTITQDVLPSVLAPLGIAIVFIVVRLVMRQPVTSAVAGALGIGISAALALLSGRAEDNFVPGFIINVVTVVAMLVSVLVRRPLVGVIVGVLTGDAEWRADPAKVRVSLVATILWAALPALRLAVQVPFYLAERPDLLAATKLVMGVPLYAILLWITWLLIRSAWSAKPPAEAKNEA
ncbi:DUF3159 domain-containing protein [Homoserinibacter sp. GY 40078]|uniref:DUF3159 domain-containing protein n=1 Tax=Homoserinibacter sp. GY 40078 TaxID=2603275 RepID=UPI0011C8BF70|nr:DUF3159 domain-containing protein [Homoserinibacter sp. GY 40078]TXK17497.1 DUF3159 domain-containing protein [Homoserinibacter sp. GY 40078]